MLFLAAALLAVSDPATEAGPPIEPTQPAPAAKPVKEKKICRVDQNESSSRLRKRVCLTAAEWELHDRGVTANELKDIGAR